MDASGELEWFEVLVRAEKGSITLSQEELQRLMATPAAPKYMRMENNGHGGQVFFIGDAKVELEN